jgi:hypothetical protein
MAISERRASGRHEGATPWGPLQWPGRPVSLATCHGKERAIARPFRVALGLELVVADTINTDSLGSFSGEIPRPADGPTTCRLKAEAGMAATGLNLGLASEGSFGPHPAIPFLPVGQEWMTFIDRDQDLVISDQLLARRTNFNHCRVGADTDLAAWLGRVGFPSHALIVRPNQGEGAMPVRKGLQTASALQAALAEARRASADGLALVETDMRAHLNPTRMAAIRALAFRLVRRIARPCPACASPGWGPVELRLGLPCRWCGLATDLIQAEVFGCVRCDHRQDVPRPDGLQAADPGHCLSCNP